MRTFAELIKDHDNLNEFHHDTRRYVNRVKAVTERLTDEMEKRKTVETTTSASLTRVLADLGSAQARIADCEGRLALAESNLAEVTASQRGLMAGVRDLSHRMNFWVVESIFASAGFCRSMRPPLNAQQYEQAKTLAATIRTHWDQAGPAGVPQQDWKILLVRQGLDDTEIRAVLSVVPELEPTQACWRSLQANIYIALTRLYSHNMV